MKAIHIVKTEHVWQAALEITASMTVRNKVILGREVTYLLCHLEAHGASLLCWGLHLSYPTAPLACRPLEPHGPLASRSHPSPELPDTALAGVCFIQQEHLLTQWHTGEAPVCPQSQEHFIQVSPVLIGILTYWHCHCMAGFSRKPSKSTAAAVSFYWHGHTWVTIWNQKMK